MSEASERIAKILEDPESLQMIAEIAESFMSEEASAETDKAQDTTTGDNQPESKGELSILPKELSSVLSGLESKISADEIDNTVRLIQAIQPYLSHKRHGSADNVIKILTALKTVSSLNLSKFVSLFDALQ